MNPILTIAIPTYNRRDAIQEQVRSLLPQLTEEVKLVVYDNHSDFFVSSLFTEDELSKFTLIRNIVNIGGDANMARCLENCNTKWLWLLGDDDFIEDNALNIVLKNILLYADATWINFGSLHDVILYGKENFLADLKDLENFGNSFWMSKCVYNMSDLKSFLFYYYKNVSSMIGQLVILIKYAIENENIKMVRLKVNLFKYHSSDISWNHQDFINYSGLLFYAFNKKEKKFLKKNVLRGLTEDQIGMLSENMDDFWGALSLIMFRYGFLRAVFTFPLLITQKIFLHIMPHYIIERLRKKYKTKKL